MDKVIDFCVIEIDGKHYEVTSMEAKNTRGPVVEILINGEHNCTLTLEDAYLLYDDLCK